MAMSVTGIRRPGSTMFCRRASRVRVLGRTVLRGVGGIARPGPRATRTRRAADRRPASGRQHHEREPHQTDRHVEVRRQAERDATEPAPAHGAAQREPSRGDEGSVAATLRSSHARPPPRGRISGPLQGCDARRIRVRSGGHPMPRVRAPATRIEAWTRALPPHRTRPRHPPTAARRHRRLLRRGRAASASRAPTTAGSPASARASPTASASTRCWSAASSPRRCCSAGSGWSSTASPGPCCPNGATAASTPRR